MPNQKAEEGRLKLRGEDGVENYVEALEERNWEKTAMNRQVYGPKRSCFAFVAW